MSITGRLDRKAFDVAVGVIERIHREAAVLDQRALGGRTAHIESDDVLKSQLLRVGAGADATADGTGLDQADGLATSAVGG